MATMKQLWWVDWDQIELREVEIPQVKPNEVKVKVAYAALCATDASGDDGRHEQEAPAPARTRGPPARSSNWASKLPPPAIRWATRLRCSPVSHCGECEWCKRA